MTRYLHYTAALLFCIFLSFQSTAQQVSNVNARLSGENVIITYDLVGAKVGQKFTVELFSSHNNYASPLEMVSGAVGENQLGGSGKQIEWRAKEELGVFTGNVTFEVKSTLTFTPIQITSPSSSSSFKPGKSMPIRWTGGMPNSTFQIDLVKTNTTLQSIGSSSNTGLYNWNVPNNVAKGNDYQIKMYDPSDRTNTEISSGIFIIKGKGGAGKILIPVAAVGATAGVLCAVGVICGGEETCEDRGDCPPTDLPFPPDPDGFVGSTRLKSGVPLLRIVLGN